MNHKTPTDPKLTPNNSKKYTQHACPSARAKHQKHAPIPQATLQRTTAAHHCKDSTTKTALKKDTSTPQQNQKALQRRNQTRSPERLEARSPQQTKPPHHLLATRNVVAGVVVRGNYRQFFPLVFGVLCTSQISFWSPRASFGQSPKKVPKTRASKDPLLGLVKGLY